MAEPSTSAEGKLNRALQFGYFGDQGLRQCISQVRSKATTFSDIYLFEILRT